MYKALFRFSTAGSKLSNICGAPQMLGKMVIFMDICRSNALKVADWYITEEAFLSYYKVNSYLYYVLIYYVKRHIHD